MIILNACKDVKVQFSDDQSLLVFSPRILTKSDDLDLCVVNDILLEKEVDHFLSGLNYSIIWSEDKSQIYGIKVDAEEDLCRTFLGELLGVDTKIFLEDE